MYKKAGETAKSAVSPAKMITIRCLPMGNYFSLMASSNWMKRPTTINTKAVTIHPAVPTDWNIPPRHDHTKAKCAFIIHSKPIPSLRPEKRRHKSLHAVSLAVIFCACIIPIFV